MPGSTLPPDQAAQMRGAIARIEQRERRTTRPPPSAPVEMVFSYPGILDPDVESPPWYPPGGGMLRFVRVSLLAVATANHVIEIRVNGVAAQQFTLGTGNRTTTQDAAIEVSGGFYVTVKTITVSQSDLSVQLTVR